MKNNHPAAGLEFENENLRPVDRHLKDKQMLFEALQCAHQTCNVMDERLIIMQHALQEATDALEWYVNQENGSHAATRLNNIADIMGWERKR